MVGVKVGWWALVGAAAVLLLLVYCPHGTPTPHLTRFTTWTYTRLKVLILLFSNSMLSSEQSPNPFSKGLMKFGCPEPSKIMFTF